MGLLPASCVQTGSTFWILYVLGSAQDRVREMNSTVKKKKKKKKKLGSWWGGGGGEEGEEKKKETEKKKKKKKKCWMPSNLLIVEVE